MTCQFFIFFGDHSLPTPEVYPPSLEFSHQPLHRPVCVGSICKMTSKKRRRNRIPIPEPQEPRQEVPRREDPPTFYKGEHVEWYEPNVEHRSLSDSQVGDDAPIPNTTTPPPPPLLERNDCACAKISTLPRGCRGLTCKGDGMDRAVRDPEQHSLFALLRHLLHQCGRGEIRGAGVQDGPPCRDAAGPQAGSQARRRSSSTSLRRGRQRACS